MSIRIAPLFLFAAALLLAACAETFQADVARFHQLPQDSTQTFKIVAIDPDKSGSLEFEQYAGLLRAQLIDQGYRPVADDPDVLVEFDWILSEGREKVFSRPGYYGHHGFAHGGFGRFGHGFGHFGHGGFGHGFGHGGFGYGGFGGGYGYGGSYSMTVHSLRATVSMLRPDGEVIFEGRADSVIGGPQLPEVMPYMVQALFTDFPGESGRTQLVELELPDDSDIGY